ncbi:putative Ntdin [Ectocarpus siliculosus]|uniref:Ntdin n=1 Tax=Ectocarpus siliculosus TaxID=2880 RepID=D7G7C7_ECTSI|nr:putative Ntdin [Ectocarpus siliculosus]|eukprot:CBJ27678.1 putative Ntdin [Ectocarpus siliculosus]
MFDEVGPQFANNLVQQEGWAYVDVRADYEFEHGRPAGAVNVPAFFSTAQGMTVNPDFVDQIAEKFPDKAAKLVIGCQMGSRSAQAAGWLENAGYSGVVNMEGGFSAWARDDSLPVEV